MKEISMDFNEYIKIVDDLDNAVSTLELENSNEYCCNSKALSKFEKIYCCLQKAVKDYKELLEADKNKLSQMSADFKFEDENAKRIFETELALKIKK